MRIWSKSNQIILLTGFPKTGKSYIGKYLTENFKFFEVSSGDVLKKYTARIFSIPLEKFYKNKSDIINENVYPFNFCKTYRDLLKAFSDHVKLYGMGEYQNEYGLAQQYPSPCESVFTKIAVNDIPLNANKIVITDLRYKYELVEFLSYIKERQISCDENWEIYVARVVHIKYPFLFKIFPKIYTRIIKEKHKFLHKYGRLHSYDKDLLLADFPWIINFKKDLHLMNKYSIFSQLKKLKTHDI